MGLAELEVDDVVDVHPLLDRCSPANALELHVPGEKLCHHSRDLHRPLQTERQHRVDVVALVADELGVLVDLDVDALVHDQSVQGAADSPEVVMDISVGLDTGLLTRHDVAVGQEAGKVAG